jgi:NTP pyrophosphatase (non-canonical NTP hydrolase)
MKMQDYQEQAGKTAIYSKDNALIYPVLGLISEAGEVAGKVKKVLRDHNGEFTVEHRDAIADEVGDCLWYLQCICTDLDLGMEEVAQRNLNKLNSRLARGVLGGSGDNR